MARPVDLLLTQAAERFAVGRFEDAAGACRAALTIDPHDARALVGLAEAEIAQGARQAGVERLIDAGRHAGRQGRAADAFTLIGRALLHAPDRLELHLDIAELEASFGQLEAATHRLESLANAYIDRGLMDEATAVVEFMEAWDPSTAIPTEATSPDPDDRVLEALEALDEIELLDEPDTGSLVVLPPPELFAAPPDPMDVTIAHPVFGRATDRWRETAAPPPTRPGRAIAAPAGPRWVPTSAPNETAVEARPRPAPEAPRKPPERPKSLDERVRQLSALPRPVTARPDPAPVRPAAVAAPSRPSAPPQRPPSNPVATAKPPLPPVPEWQPKAPSSSTPTRSSLAAKLRSAEPKPAPASPAPRAEAPRPAPAPQVSSPPSGDLAAKLRRQSGLGRANGWHPEERLMAPGKRDTGEFEQV